jgi:hypothetical protein
MTGINVNNAQKEAAYTRKGSGRKGGRKECCCALLEDAVNYIIYIYLVNLNVPK